MNFPSSAIQLQQNHIEYSDTLGIRRNTLARAEGRKAKFHLGTPEEAEWMDVMGARCECAAYLWLRPIVWNRWIQEIERIPDLDCFIDVKGRERPGDDIFVHSDDPEDWAIVLISARRHPLYSLIGWRWASEVQKPKYLAPQLRKEGEPVLYRIRPPHRTADELINVIWQREMADDIYAPHSSSTVHAAPIRI
jgi:hypothetical protein